MLEKEGEASVRVSDIADIDHAEASRRPSVTSKAAVTRLDLHNFRNYRSARLECDTRPVILTGSNGAGKTNLLEALSFLAPGRGLRRAKLSEIDGRSHADAGAPHHPPAWAVSARLTNSDGELTIGTGRDPAAMEGRDGSGRRLVRVDGQLLKGQAGLARHLNLVWLTPQMDRLFQEGAGPRRRFLDRLVFGFDIEHAQRLSAYDQALRERARLLREGQADPHWLDLLEQKMAREGVAIAAARIDTASRLAQTAMALPVSAFPIPRLAVHGAVESWLGVMPALAVEEKLARELAAARRADALSGGALLGPHRSDFQVFHATKMIEAPNCSTGEQKAFLIAIVLAHASLRMELCGSIPILLLDEVAAHLDQERRRALFARLHDLGCQAWLTGTDSNLFSELKPLAQFFMVSDGAVMRI